MTGLRERARQAVRAELTEVALRLFAERGFEETTVDDIAREAGMSKRSFFRYFPAKEDVVLGGVDLMGELIVAELAARPPAEDPWSCLHAVLRGWAERIDAEQRALESLRLIEATPALRARFHAKREETRLLVADALVERGVEPFTADLLTAAAGAALECASRAWAGSDGADRLALVDRAFAELRPAR
ncbi:TetR family transcriptional regulator [Actinomadura kijaniata]|uniref:AcrR family transcriptional regulator n=1 Tax=Actinomadura namibiensis TaxID=182080 RepID=A0A7W3QNV4_ACTNM|nr:TetR family transcriptional regulator [Actinomadura namibiensis]MBA8953999.1 AcrR family transcriptional regulator [Actinomadura namibiensis]